MIRAIRGIGAIGRVAKCRDARLVSSERASVPVKSYDVQFV